MSKGISPIIATVILIAIVMSVAILVSSFFPGVLTGLTGKTTNKTKTVAGSTDYSIDLVTAKYNPVDDQTTVTISNKKDKIAGNITFTVFCTSSQTHQKQLKGLSKAQVKQVIVDTPNCKPKKVSALLNDYPVKAEISSISTSSYGSWLQEAAAEFKSVAKSTKDIFFGPLTLNQVNSTQSETSSFSGNMVNVTESGGELRLAT